MTVNFPSGGADSICWSNELWDLFLLQAHFEGLPCLPSDSGTPLWAFHKPREPLSVISDLASMSPYHSVNICFKAHWPRSQGSGSCSGLTSNCLGSWGKAIPCLWAFIYSTWDEQTGMAAPRAMLRRILKLFPDLPGKNTWSTDLPAAQERVLTINLPSLKCRILNDCSIRRFSRIMPMILSVLPEKTEGSPLPSLKLFAIPLSILALHLMLPKQIGWILFHNRKLSQKMHHFPQTIPQIQNKHWNLGTMYSQTYLLVSPLLLCTCYV